MCIRGPEWGLSSRWPCWCPHQPPGLHNECPDPRAVQRAWLFSTHGCLNFNFRMNSDNQAREWGRNIKVMEIDIHKVSVTITTVFSLLCTALTVPEPGSFIKNRDEFSTVLRLGIKGWQPVSAKDFCVPSPYSRRHQMGSFYNKLIQNNKGIPHGDYPKDRPSGTQSPLSIVALDI